MLIDGGGKENKLRENAKEEFLKEKATNSAKGKRKAFL